jgi:hypothetical protein
MIYVYSPQFGRIFLLSKSTSWTVILDWKSPRKPVLADFQNFGVFAKAHAFSLTTITKLVLSKELSGDIRGGIKSGINRLFSL